MRLPILSVVVLATLAGAVAGDIVVMRDGTVYEGQVTKGGGVVTIKLADRQVIEVPEGDVRRIAESVSTPSSAPASGPASGPAVALPPASEPAPADLASIDRPEALVFLAMRNLSSATGGGMTTTELRQQLSQFLAMAHDRKRRMGLDWWGPADFQKRRAAYEAMLKQAADDAKKVKPNADAGAKESALLAARARLRMAVQAWPDDIIRAALTGMLSYEIGDYNNAEHQFRDAAKSWPDISAFQQGYALALIGRNEPLDAMTPIVELFRLEPESRIAYDIARRAMRSTPGADIQHPMYVQVKGIVDEFQVSPGSPATSGTTVTWLMPGRGTWQTKDKISLPVPPYDRLYFLQCVGVPIAKHTLLVDASAVQDAEEAFVQIDAKTTIPAGIRKLTSAAGGAKPLPLATLTVAGYEFTPATIERKGAFTAGMPVTAYTMNLYPGMGRSMRKLAGKIDSVDKQGQPSASLPLAPGETAAAVITDDGRLAGVMAGRTDILAEMGGPDTFIAASQVAPLAQTSGVDYGSYGMRLKRNMTTQTVKGGCFVVTLIASETFKD